ncbi:MAG: hypothetical protein IKR81_00195, partial [Victivallales bacterium]|nr:hypothetical protein [Victivallales bacterium]
MIIYSKYRENQPATFFSTQIPSWISNPSAIDMSRVSGGKNIAVGEASAFGASETHGISVFPHLFAPCRGAARRRKNQQVLSTNEALR